MYLVFLEEMLINLGLLKVDVPYLVFGLKCTSLFGWCIFGCESKNEHQKEMYLKRDLTT